MSFWTFVFGVICGGFVGVFLANLVQKAASVAWTWMASYSLVKKSDIPREAPVTPTKP